MAKRNSKRVNRRKLMLGGLAVAGAYVLLRKASEAFQPEFEFTEIPGLPEFRTTQSGQVSGGFDPFIGIDPESSDPEIPQIDDVAICRDLFEGPVKFDQVRIASFSDYNCPYCRILTKMLAKMEAQSQQDIAVTWHELPLLGKNSVAAARAALAAKQQGSYTEFHKILMVSRFEQGEVHLRQLGQAMGLDTEQLIRDYQSVAVLEEIGRSMRLAEMFGFFGTPALVVGRTAVLGQISETKLRKLIDLELRDPGNICS